MIIIIKRRVSVGMFIHSFISKFFKNVEGKSELSDLKGLTWKALNVGLELRFFLMSVGSHRKL